MDRNQDRRDDRYDNQKEYRDDRHEYVEDRYRRRVGTALTISAWNSLTCAPRTVYVGGVSYYQCGSYWYNRAYSGGSVTYVVVTTPAGY
jgi:hypothetical protein